MRRTFNCGVGMTVIVSEHDVDITLESLSQSGERAWVLGHVEAGESGVVYR